MARNDERGCDLPDGADALGEKAIAVLKLAGDLEVRLATAESCTGGLLASLLTDQHGLGKWFDRGYVVYTEKAKAEMLGIDPAEIDRHGAVSATVAHRLAERALALSEAAVAVGITGFAGPGGPDDEVGLVYLAAHDDRGEKVACECHFGDIGRDRTRAKAVTAALDLVERLLRARAAEQAREPAHSEASG